MKIIEFFKLAGKLKITKRTGWVKNNVPNPESVADHSFRTAIMVMVLAPKIGVDVNKSIKMALVHDIGEAKVGDVVKFEGRNFLPGFSEKYKKKQKRLKK